MLFKLFNRKKSHKFELSQNIRMALKFMYKFNVNRSEFYCVKSKPNEITNWDWARALFVISLSNARVWHWLLHIFEHIFILNIVRCNLFSSLFLAFIHILQIHRISNEFNEKNEEFHFDDIMCLFGYRRFDSFRRR